MVPSDAPKDSIKRSFWKLRLLCHPEKGRTQEAFVRLQRAHRNLTEPDVRNVHDLEGCDAAENILTFKNNPD